MAELDGVWNVARTGGALPPLLAVRKEIDGTRGVTRVGPLPGVPFRVDGLKLRYRAPFSAFVDELEPAPEGFRGRAMFRGRELGRFLMRRVVGAAEQLAALAGIHELLERRGIEYWLFGGWAVDFHAGSITRAHDDIDIAVWVDDYGAIAELLTSDGWRHAPEAGEDGYTGYERDGVRLELAFLARDDSGEVYTPLQDGRGTWPPEAFESAVAELSGVRARVISLRALKADKSEAHSDPRAAAKDRADLTALGRVK